MKKILFSIMFSVISLIGNCQNLPRVNAMLTGYKKRDTIKIADFLKLSEVSLDNKEYSITSFNMTFYDGGSTVRFDSNSNKITDEMKNGLSNRKDKDSKFFILYIQRITAIKSQNETVRVPALAYLIQNK